MSGLLQSSRWPSATELESFPQKPQTALAKGTVVQPANCSFEARTRCLLCVYSSRKRKWWSRQWQSSRQGSCQAHDAEQEPKTTLTTTLQICVTAQEIDRQRFLLRYVQNVGPEVMEDFVRHAPAHVSPAQPYVWIFMLCSNTR